MKQANKKFKFLVLTASVLAIMGPMSAASASEFTPEQEKKLGEMMKQFIMDNPDVIMKSVEQYQIEQQRKMQMGAEEALKESYEYYINKDLPSAGNPDGDVTVVEYFDYNCGYCRRAFADIVDIIEQDKNVRVVFQDLPVLGTDSYNIAVLSMASHKQGKYFEFHKAIMGHSGPQDMDTILGVAEKAGLDVEKLKEDMNDPEIETTLRKHAQMAQSIGINGTPGFIIGEKLFPGYIGLQGMEKEINAARNSDTDQGE